MQSTEVEEIAVGGDGIRLGQLLKLAGLAGTGGEAKYALAEGQVTVNGAVDRRRGAQRDLGNVAAEERRDRAARVPAVTGPGRSVEASGDHHELGHRQARRYSVNRRVQRAAAPPSSPTSTESTGSFTGDTSRNTTKACR